MSKGPSKPNIVIMRSSMRKFCSLFSQHHHPQRSTHILPSQSYAHSMIITSSFKFFKPRIASRSFPISSRPYISSSFTSHPTAIFFKRPLSLLSFASDPLINRSSQWSTLFSNVRTRRYHHDSLDSSSSSLQTPVSPYEAIRRRLRMEIADLLHGSRILERRIGSFDPPDELDRLGRVFLIAIKSSILAAKESDGQDWEQALYQALLRAAKRRVEVGHSKKGRGLYMKLKAQIGLDDVRLATAILRSKSSQRGSNNGFPSLETHVEIVVRHMKEDVEVLLGGDDFLSQSIGQLPPIKLRSLDFWTALKRLVVTSLALLPYSKVLDGRFPLLLCQTLEAEALERIERQTREKIKRPRRATLADLDAAEERLHEQRIKKIGQELLEFKFDQVSVQLFENVPAVPESEAQASRFNPEPDREATRYKRRISELWKNEDWTSEYLFPHFPPITFRHPGILSTLELIASVTAAQERGQCSGYPIIVKKSVRRAVLERILDHDFRDRRQKRSDSQILLEDVKRAVELVEEWREMNPEERLR